MVTLRHESADDEEEILESFPLADLCASRNA
jgi:hypothetical protein